jgi:hypothetical protein
MGLQERANDLVRRYLEAKPDAKISHVECVPVAVDPLQVEVDDKFSMKWTLRVVETNDTLDKPE